MLVEYFPRYINIFLFASNKEGGRGGPAGAGGFFFVILHKSIFVKDFLKRVFANQCARIKVKQLNTFLQVLICFGTMLI